MRAYELIHVDSEWAGLPAFIGVGPTVAEPWLPRWKLRAVDGSRLGEFFRGLDARRLTPIESFEWLPRSSQPPAQAFQLARLRLQQIAAWADVWPAWLLNNRPGHPAGSELRPVACIRSNGEIERFPSFKKAAEAAGMTRPGLMWFVRTGHSDRSGAVWVDAARDPA